MYKIIKVIILYITINNLLFSNIEKIEEDKSLKITCFYEIKDHWEGTIKKKEISKNFTKNSKVFGYNIIEKVNNPLRIIALNPNNELIQITLKDYKETQKNWKITKEKDKIYFKTPFKIIFNKKEEKFLKIPIKLNSEKFFKKIKITPLNDNFFGITPIGIFDINNKEVEFQRSEYGNETFNTIENEYKSIIFKGTSNLIIEKNYKIPLPINKELINL